MLSSQPFAAGADKPYDTKAADLVAGFMAAHAAGDVDRAVDDYIAADAVYTLHVDHENGPVGGRVEGSEAIRACLKRYHVIFEYIVFRGHTVSACDGIVRQRLEYILRHRASNERWSGHGRLVWTASHGRLSRCEEYLDEAMLQTFFRLFGAGEDVPPNPAVRGQGSPV